jgi:hypothetical protein
MRKWIFDKQWSRHSGKRKPQKHFEAFTFTVRTGVRYRATVVLSWIEQMAATNEMIAGKLVEVGFEKVVVTGSGARRLAEATWTGEDTTSELDPHLRDVSEVTELASGA